MEQKRLHIISFDVPYPANYGGVIDVFYKLKYLKEKGVEVILHCFEYGRSHAPVLEELASQVYYYPRKTGWKSNLSTQPYIVRSRNSEALKERLLEDCFPILAEGMHSMGVLLDKRFQDRFKIYRESNIEHHYYYHLFKSEQNWFKKGFFLIESIKLKYFESKVKKIDLSLAVSQQDANYLQEHYPNSKVVYLPSFHNNTEITSHEGMGDYALYNGNLSVAENIDAVEYLVKNVFSKIDYPLVVAGLNPPESLKQLLAAHQNIRLIENPTDEQMQQLIAQAHINVLYTHQATGLKLKLLNTLFIGRFCLLNDKMIAGTHLEEACQIVDSAEAFIAQIDRLKDCVFSKTDIEKRAKIMSPYYDNDKNIQQLIDLIFKDSTCSHLS